MDEILETVKVKHPGGYVIINKDDFDPERHELFDSEPEAAPKRTYKKRGE
jgi:hypothetical protein